MKQKLRQLFYWVANKMGSKPNAPKVEKALTDLYVNIVKNNDRAGVLTPKKGAVIGFETHREKFIIFSDQHKGNGDHADDFLLASANYLSALRHYFSEGFVFINLGDCEELWENKPEPVVQFYKEILVQEAAFETANRHYKIFGNHDLLWFDKLAVKQFLHPVFGPTLQVWEGIVLQTTIAKNQVSILLTHGHQGDAASDGNTMSKWFIGRVWVPIQRWLNINLNTPAKDFHLTDKHNKMMYEWSSKQPNLLLITGHTHKPVFESLDYIQRLNKQMEDALATNNVSKVNRLALKLADEKLANENMHTQKPQYLRPSYYNTGCCCFADGDITGIEICNGHINLIKWHQQNGVAVKSIIETATLENVVAQLIG